MFSQDKFIFITLLLAVITALISAECPNACSSHGKCGAYDSCECYRNWMSNDCSERICQFGLAHVDTPKGDLDASSGELYSPEATATTQISAGSRVASKIITGDAMYPKGTYEKFPNMVDSTNFILSNTAHDYMECSNKGLCDRSDGSCVCFEGYEGSACQRASCPISNDGVCSGHGTCSTIKDIARNDYNNSYNLWDEEMTMGCVCDPGFEGPDCSKAMCKFGADPLYYDDDVNQRYANFTFALWNLMRLDSDVVTASGGESILSAKWAGNFSIVFYDHFGKPWWTDPIDIKADCDAITNALEDLPNDVIKSGSVRCSHDDIMYGTYLNDDGEGASVRSAGDGDQPHLITGMSDGYPIDLPTEYKAISTNSARGGTLMPQTGKKFTLAFPSNTGKLRQPEIDIYLDGNRPTVTSGSEQFSSDEYVGDAVTTDRLAYAKVHTWVYPNGFTGEDVDFVPDQCTGVKVTLKSANDWTELTPVGTDATKKLKACLGDSDGDPTNNNNVGKEDTTLKADTADALFDWDYGIELEGGAGFDMDKVIHPHLIKLVDTTSDTATRLCTAQDGHITGVDHINEIGYCFNGDAAGFYGVLYYRDKKFIIMSRANQDYSNTAKFNVFTTTGYLRLASAQTSVFTSFGGLTDTVAQGLTDANYGTVKRDLTSFYSNVVYTTRKTASGINNVDCETQGTNTGFANVYQCIEKGDYVMIFDLENGSGSKNPKYPNMYQVMKISRENREAVENTKSSDITDSGAFEQYRYQIVLDYGMNARYPMTAADADNKARIFKFTPPTTAVTWVAQCSNRGICDGGSGICQCFPGYSGDDCSTMNALAQ